MLISVAGLIAASFSNFHAGMAFHYPHGAFGPGFAAGLGAGLIIGIYDYGGYYTTAYMGDELKNPGRTMPRSIVISIVAMMIFYLAMNIGVLGVIPWHVVGKSSSIASLVFTHTWGGVAADAFTILIVITAFASVFAGLLGGSRVPYHASRDGVFFSAFAHMHPRHGFPSVALLAMGVITAIGTFLPLTTVINVLAAVIVFVQAVAQIVALTVLRRRQPDLPRPYRQWLYPVPSLIALAGWLYVYASAQTLSLELSGAWLAAGVLAFLAWAHHRRAWPFGPRRIREAFLPGRAVNAAAESRVSTHRAE